MHINIHSTYLPTYKSWTEYILSQTTHIKETYEVCPR